VTTAFWSILRPALLQSARLRIGTPDTARKASSSRVRHATVAAAQMRASRLSIAIPQSPSHDIGLA
jgi:hypothetical protein